MKLADYLKQYRKENNLTQQELADKLFVSKQAVSKWETERGLPDIETYKSLSASSCCVKLFSFLYCFR